MIKIWRTKHKKSLVDQNLKDTYLSGRWNDGFSARIKRAIKTSEKNVGGISI